MKKVTFRIFLYIFPVLFFTALSCEREDPDKPHPVSIESLTGLVQKGPFMNGTSVNVAELTEKLIQSGKNFNTQISDNRGSFELKQVELSSQFVELSADGFYFNEVTGNPSSARLVLYALSNLGVDILPSLKRKGIHWLLRSHGQYFLTGSCRFLLPTAYAIRLTGYYPRLPDG